MKHSIMILALIGLAMPLRAHAIQSQWGACTNPNGGTVSTMAANTPYIAASAYQYAPIVPPDSYGLDTWAFLVNGFVQVKNTASAAQTLTVVGEAGPGRPTL